MLLYSRKMLAVRSFHHLHYPVANEETLRLPSTNMVNINHFSFILIINHLLIIAEEPRPH